jgi:hypothetical protein
MHCSDDTLTLVATVASTVVCGMIAFSSLRIVARYVYLGIFLAEF